MHKINMSISFTLIIHSFCASVTKQIRKTGSGNFQKNKGSAHLRIRSLTFFVAVDQYKNIIMAKCSTIAKHMKNIFLCLVVRGVLIVHSIACVYACLCLG